MLREVKLNFIRSVTATFLGLAVMIVSLISACSASPRTPHHPAAHAVTARTLTLAQMRQECAALGMVRMGYDTYANQVLTVAGQYRVTQTSARALIRQAVSGYCPSEVSAIPEGGA